LTAGPTKSAECIGAWTGGLAVMGLERELIVADNLLGHGGSFWFWVGSGEIDDGKLRWSLLV